jgi:hypothetical protein
MSLLLAATSKDLGCSRAMIANELELPSDCSTQSD